MTVKRTLLGICFPLFFWACTTAKTPAPVKLEPNFGQPENSSPPSLLWSKRMSGAISDLGVAQNGQSILVATSPDPEIAGSVGHFLLSLYDVKGRLRWSSKVKSPVKEQDISDDGNLVVISNYESEVMGLNRMGKVLWSVEGLCRPLILNQVRKVLCYHDDDAEPRVAYDTYDWSGKNKFSFPIDRDILSLKVSPDESSIVMGLTEGQVLLVSIDNELLWKKEVSGEIVDLSVSQGSQSKVAVLHSKKGSLKVSVFDRAGKELNSFSPRFKSSQVEISPTGESVFVYGNSKEGQYLEKFAVSASSNAPASWHRGSPLAADFSPMILVSPETVFMGYADILPHLRRTHLLGFDFEGKFKWDVQLPTDLGAYFSTQRMAMGGSLLVISTDDALLSVYRVK